MKPDRVSKNQTEKSTSLKVIGEPFVLANKTSASRKNDKDLDSCISISTGAGCNSNFHAIICSESLLLNYTFSYLNNQNAIQLENDFRKVVLYN